MSAKKNNTTLVEISNNRNAPPVVSASILSILGGDEKMFVVECHGPGSCSRAVVDIRRAVDRRNGLGLPPIQLDELCYKDLLTMSQQPDRTFGHDKRTVIHIVHDYISSLTVRREVLRDEDDEPQDLNQNGQAQTNVDGVLRELTEASRNDKVVVLCREYDGECIQHLTTAPLSFERIVFDRPKALEYLCHRFALDPPCRYASIVSELDSWSALRHLPEAIQASLMKSTRRDSVVLFDLFEFLLPKILADELEPPLSLVPIETIVQGVYGSNEGVNFLGPFHALAQAAIARAFGPPQRPVNDQGVNTTASVFHAMMGNPAAELSELQYELLTSPVLCAATSSPSATAAAAITISRGGGLNLATATQTGGTTDEWTTSEPDEPLSPK